MGAEEFTELAPTSGEHSASAASDPACPRLHRRPGPLATFTSRLSIASQKSSRRHFVITILNTRQEVYP